MKSKSITYHISCQQNQNGVYISERSKNSITNGLNFALKNETFTTIDELRVEERKERKEKKGTPRKSILFYCCYSFRTSQNVVALQVIKPQLLVVLDTS